MSRTSGRLAERLGGLELLVVGVDLEEEPGQRVGRLVDDLPEGRPAASASSSRLRPRPRPAFASVEARPRPRRAARQLALWARSGCVPSIAASARLPVRLDLGLGRRRGRDDPAVVGRRQAEDVAELTLGRDQVGRGRGQGELEALGCCSASAMLAACPAASSSSRSRRTISSPSLTAFSRAPDLIVLIRRGPSIAARSSGRGPSSRP